MLRDMFPLLLLPPFRRNGRHPGLAGLDNTTTPHGQKTQGCVMEGGQAIRPSTRGGHQSASASVTFLVWAPRRDTENRDWALLGSVRFAGRGPKISM